ncbi:MAG: DNA polymerase III subunit gamma/tau, partial [Novosphingobium sp.]|nr:DNA polymerase III subunit gamma/tau [Novosphingobium sp.]
LDWEALVEQMERHGEHMLANKMKLQVRVIELSPGVLRYAQPPGFKEDLAPELRAALLTLTDERWNVELTEGEARPTLVEREEALVRADEAATRKTPLVEATLAAFPDAELIKEDNRAAASGGGRNWSNTQ